MWLLELYVDLEAGYIMALQAMKDYLKMKIDKKLIKELVDHLSEFNLTEIEYQDGEKRIKVSKATKGIEKLNQQRLCLLTKLF